MTETYFITNEVDTWCGLGDVHDKTHNLDEIIKKPPSPAPPRIATPYLNRAMSPRTKQDYFNDVDFID
jgi:hypothetical protein